MKQKFLLKTMLLLCALVAGSTSVWGDTETFSYSDYKGEGTTSTGSEYTMVKDYVSITETKFYCGSSATYAQFYAGGVSTVTPASGVTITGIVLTATAAGYNGYQSSGTITASNGSVSGSGTTVTWTGSATSAFTISHSKQIRWTSIVVTYTKSGSGSSAVATTTTIDASGITNTDVYTSTAAGTLTATVTPEGESALASPAITWTSSNTGVATITSGGVVTLVAAGTTTITASYAGNATYAASSRTYELTVTDSNPAIKISLNNTTFGCSTGNNPDEQSFTASEIFVVAGCSSSASSKTYYDSGHVRFYADSYLVLTAPTGYNITKTVFTSGGTWNGSISPNAGTYDNSTKTWTGEASSLRFDFAAQNRISSVAITLEKQKAESDLTKTNNINLSMASPSTTANATDYFTTSSTGAITYESGNTSVVTVSDAGVVTPVAQGSTTITVSQAADADYKAGEITINVIVAAASLNSTTIVANASGSTTYGTPKVEDYMIDETYDGTIAAVSSNTDVATVAITQHSYGDGTFTIAPVAVGTAVITISAPATVTCEAATPVTYTITVTAPVGGTTAAPAPTNLFVERFSAAEGTGPSGDSWSGSIASGVFVSDNAEWSYNVGYAGDGCARFGNSGNNGGATTPAISFDPSVTYTLTFKAGAWNNDGTTLTLSCDDDDAVLGQTSFTMKNNEWTEYETTVKAAAGSKLTFATNDRRFFLDDVVISSGVSLKATLNASGYATYCSEYPLDFSGASDYTAWQITGVSGSTITFSKITGDIKGGQGILLMGTPNATITLTSTDSDNELSSNKLVGTTAPTYVAASQYYGLKGNEFVPVAASTVRAGKAILPVDAVSVKAFNFVFEDDADGINAIDNGELTIDNAAIYNLAGQRLSKMQKGINIVNGKKILY